MLLCQVHELLVPHVARAHDHHILSEVVACVEVNHHVAIDLSNVVHISKDGLAHHMLSIDVVVYIFHQRFFRIFVYRFKLGPNRVLLLLQVSWVISRIAQHVPQQVHRLAHTVRKRLHVVEGELAARVSVQMRTHILNFGFELEARAPRCALEVKMLQKVSCARGVKCLIPAPCPNEDTHGRNRILWVGL